MSTLTGLFVFLAALSVIGAVGVAIARGPGREALALLVCGLLLALCAVGVRAASYNDRLEACIKKEEKRWLRWNEDGGPDNEADFELYDRYADESAFARRQCARAVKRIGGEL